MKKVCVNTTTMLDAIMYILAAGLFPVLVNKTTERLKFGWLQDHIRSLWMVAFAIFTIYFIHRSELPGVIMSGFKKWNITPFYQYLIVGLGGAMISCTYWWLTSYIFKDSNYSKLILSVQHLEITDPKANLTMNVLFHNEGTKELVIDKLFMITPGNSMSTLDDNDNLLNNFNGKVNLEYKWPDGKIIYPAGYYGLGPIKSGFPKVLKSGELCPLEINLPFKTGEFLKEKKLSNIKKIPIGLMIWTMNYKGQKYEVTAYPIAELHILNDNEIKGMYYNSQKTYSYEIEKCNQLPSRVKSIVVEPGSTITPNADTTDVLEIKIK